MPLIFQYGSNCDAERFKERLASHGSAQDLGLVQTVDEYEIAFNKWSKKGDCAAADLIKLRKGGRRVWGVLYNISRAGFKKLKQIEGPGYRPQRIPVEDATGVMQIVTTFRVRQARRQNDLHTNADYVGHIVKGLRDHGVPDEYTQHVIDVAIQTNQRATATIAAAEQSHLIEQLRRPQT